MNKDNILYLLDIYEPSHPEDRKFRREIVTFVEEHTDFASRSNFLGHLTVSAWIVSPDRSQVLLLHHRKLDRWLQPGGHIENDDSLLDAAIREAEEETGLSNLNPFSDYIFDLDIHLIPARKADPEHNHLDIRFLVEADPEEQLNISPESNSLRWFELDELVNLGLDWSVMRMLGKTQKG